MHTLLTFLQGKVVQGTGQRLVREGEGSQDQNTRCTQTHAHIVSIPTGERHWSETSEGGGGRQGSLYHPTHS